MNKIIITLLLFNLLIQNFNCSACSEAGNDADCSTQAVTADSNNLCIDNPKTGTGQTHCLEISYCEQIESKAKETDCQHFNNNITFYCTLSGTGSTDAAKCIATKKYCEEVQTGADKDICESLKNTTFECSNNNGKCESKQIYCEGIQSGANDEICGQFSNDTDKCEKKENKCNPTKYCENVAYTDSINCENYPTKKTGNKCHKDDKACKEYTPADEEDGVNGLKISLIMLIILSLF